MANRAPVGYPEFVLASSRSLARTAFLLTGDRGHAEDLVQQALIATLRMWDRVELPEAYARTTLTRLAARAARRRWRGEVPTPDVELADAAPPAGAVDDGVITGMEVRRLLASLPWEQRVVLVLRFLDDLSEQDTADMLGCSVGTVKSRASRGLARLREAGVLQTEVHDG